MKTIFYTIIFFILFTTCSNPIKLLEQRRDAEALAVTMNRMENGIIKPHYVAAFEFAFHSVLSKKIRKIQKIEFSDHPQKWHTIHDKALSIEKHQKRTHRLIKQIQKKGYDLIINFYNTDSLIQVAKTNIAKQYYEEALTFLPAVVKGDRLAAREAYVLLQDCRKYDPDYLQSEVLESKMFEIGTIHILMEPKMMEIEKNIFQELVHSFFGKKEFPIRKEWYAYYREKPKGKPLDFYVNFHFQKLWTSGHDSSSSSCSNTEDVQVGCTEVLVFNEKDSTYSTVQQPIYEEASVEVTTYSQSKSAGMELHFEIRKTPNDSIFSSNTIRQDISWSNEYSTYTGDLDALGWSCSHIGGGELFYPSDLNLWKDCAFILSNDFYQKLKETGI